MPRGNCRLGGAVGRQYHPLRGWIFADRSLARPEAFADCQPKPTSMRADVPPPPVADATPPEPPPNLQGKHARLERPMFTDPELRCDPETRIDEDENPDPLSIDLAGVVRVIDDFEIACMHQFIHRLDDGRELAFDITGHPLLIVEDGHGWVEITRQGVRLVADVDEPEHGGRLLRGHTPGAVEDLREYFRILRRFVEAEAALHDYLNP